MNCKLPQKIGTPSGGGGVALPDGAYVPVTKFTDGRTYALVAKIDGTYRYINTTAFNDWTMNATEVEVTEKSDYVLFGSEPALFTAKASGDGFTLANGSNFLHGTSSGGTALRVGTTSAVWKVDTSETGGFDSGKYLPKEVSTSVWLKNTSGSYDWCIKFESAGSFGYDRAGRDNTYSTGFVSFVLYEKYEGQTSGGDSGGDSGGGSAPSEYAVTIVEGSGLNGALADYISYGIFTITVDGKNINAQGTYTASSGSTLNINMLVSATWKVVVNGATVRPEGYEEGTYTYTIDSTTTLTLTQESGGGTIIFTITTEGGSSGGGSTPSEYALTYSISGTNRLCTIQIGSGSATTFPSSATTTAVAAGTSVTVTIGSVYQQTRMTIKYNGQTVATGSSTNSSPSYTFQMTANTTVKVTQNGSGTSSYPTCVITTE